MLIRKVKIGDTIYGAHVIRNVSYADDSRAVYIDSYETEEDVDNPAKSAKSTALAQAEDTSKLFEEMYEWVAAQPEFAEYHDEAQEALDEVLPILTDEQAEQVPDAFPLWKVDTAYEVGYRVRYEELLYKCVQAHTSQADWTPPVAVSLWVRIGGGEIPEWIQPTGAHDAYAKGDKVRHNGAVWVSEIDANVYEPGVYGWSEE